MGNFLFCLLLLLRTSFFAAVSLLCCCRASSSSSSSSAKINIYLLIPGEKSPIIAITRFSVARPSAGRAKKRGCFSHGKINRIPFRALKPNELGSDGEKMRKEELDYCQQINRYNRLFFLVGRVCCAHVNMICELQVAPRPLAVLQRDSSNHLNSHTLHGRKKSIHTRVANVLTDAQGFPFQPLEPDDAGAVSFTRRNLGTPLSQLAQEHTEKEIRASVYLFFPPRVEWSSLSRLDDNLCRCQ